MDHRTVLLVATGLFAGILSGLFGIGGGLVIVPVLVAGFAMPIHRAIGTSLAALLLPVGALGALDYWRRGFMDGRAALLIALGLFVGAFVGARVSHAIPPAALRRLYGALLVVVGARLLIAR